MRSSFWATLFILLAVAVSPAPLLAHGAERLRAPGDWVDVSVTVNGQPTPVYAAVDGSNRWYLEARRAARYAVRVKNRTRERLGVLLTVDGLNVVSGEQERTGPSPGRMYVLGPRQDVNVRGWRTSLQQVRRFTFVDEQRSYATRTGQANDRMGWIEVQVYRERRPLRRLGLLGEDSSAEPRASGKRQAPPAAAGAAQGRAEAAEAPDGKASRSARRESFPGTGWGDAARDPAVRVHFSPEAQPVDTVTLRYEYRRSLIALGILPGRTPHDRLTERERGGFGFARPPSLP